MAAFHEEHDDKPSDLEASYFETHPPSHQQLFEGLQKTFSVCVL